MSAVEQIPRFQSDAARRNVLRIITGMEHEANALNLRAMGLKAEAKRMREDYELPENPETLDRNGFAPLK